MAWPKKKHSACKRILNYSLVMNKFQLESFKYLDRYFNFEMDNEEHKKRAIRYYQQNIEQS